MWSSLLLGIILAPCLYTMAATSDQCVSEEEDPKVYLFGYGYNWGHYEYLNDDGELMGLGYDITRTVCKAMKKKCEHMVIYDYTKVWDNQGKSTALNNGWYGAHVSWVPTPRRVSAYAFFGEFGREPNAHMWVRIRDRTDTVDEIKDKADKFGFREGFRLSPACLGDYLGQSVADKAVEYADGAALQNALANNEVDVIFLDEADIIDQSIVKKVGPGPISCGLAGVSVMTRKDSVQDYAWYDEGLAKIRANGDYKWLCNLMNKEYDTGCF